MAESIFYGISVILGIVLISLLITKFFKQPMIIGYILAGTLISIFFPHLLGNTALESFSHIGISFLLFMVGMELHPSIIKQLGKDSLIAGTSQVIITFALGFGLAYLLGFDTITAIFLGLAFSFSSTIVILKLLGDRGKTEQTFGKLSIGILVVQDLVVILAFLVLGTISSFGNNGGLEVILLLLGKVVLVTTFLILSAKKAIPFITKKISDSTEFLFLFAVGWCFLLASLFQVLGFGMEIGALLAGITLATSSFRFEIASRVKSLRDFFIVMFFVLLGSHVSIEYSLDFFLKVGLFTAFILLIKPIIVDIILGLLGHTKKNILLAGLSLGQISEFSFLLITMGISMGYITNTQLLSEITLTGLLTIAISSYYIIYGENIYHKVKPYLKYLPGKRHRNYNTENKMDSEVLILGFGKFGNNLYETLRISHPDVMVVDENPRIISHLEKKGIKCMYGDIANIEFLEELHITKTKMVISTVKKYEDDLILLENIKRRNPNIIVILISKHIEEAIDFYEKGADYVILPHYIGANHTSLLLEEYGFDIKRFLENKKHQVQQLKNRNKEFIIEALQRL